MTDQIKRTPAGIPTGGQFASHDRPEAEQQLVPTLDASHGPLADERLRAAASEQLKKIDDLRRRTAEALIGAQLRPAWPNASSATFDWDQGFGRPLLVRVESAEGEVLYDLRDNHDNGERYRVHAGGVDVEDLVFAAHRTAATIPILSASSGEVVVDLNRELPRVLEAKFGGEDEFIVVEGGLVQNSPLLPVWDMDELEHGDEDAIENVRRNLAEAEQLGAHDIATRLQGWLAGPN